jgi:lipid A 3-O-deacylase
VIKGALKAAVQGAALSAGLLLMALPSGAAWADDPDFISGGAGYYDWNRQKNTAAEFRAEYRSDYKLWIFKPFGGVMATSDGAFYAYTGLGIDVYLGSRFVITPSIAPGFYAQGGGLDLGYPLEFRSQLEIAYRFDDRSRLGVAISHMSNASIVDENPGTESAVVYYSVPLSTLLGR